MRFEGKMMLSSDEQLLEDYHLGNELGRGTFSVVRVARNVFTGQEFACKIVTKRKLRNQRELDMIYNEIETMRLFNHSNVVALYRVYESREKIYMIMEYLSGGELFNRIVKHFPDGYSEKDAANLFAMILDGIAHVHQHNIVHRDLKPENLIFIKENTLTHVKITDFGLSREVKAGQKLTDAVGTPQYVAPEVIQGIGHDTKSDMWSLGVILYILLCGGTPFYAENDTELFRQIVAGRYGFPTEYFGDISAEAKDLVRHLLQVDPRKRYSAKQSLEHPWIANRELNSTARMAIAKKNLEKNMDTIGKKTFRTVAISVVAAGRLLGPEDRRDDNNVDDSVSPNAEAVRQLSSMLERVAPSS